ncbi:DHH family phosphoesterase [Porphyromonadaceae bacterium W3.11]|nr:DHH family phosphoesterase [Porphyromonadaceae bacterium W3.11]
MSHKIAFNIQDLERIKDHLSTPRNIVLLGHVSPDGDALGSTLALSRLLQKLGHQTSVIYPTSFAENLSFLSGAVDAIIAKDNEKEAKRLLKTCDTIFCMDFNEAKRVEFLANDVTSSSAFKVLIDHHLHPSDFVDIIISYPSLSSTCLLAYQLIEKIGWKRYMDKEIAEAIYTGMMTDTGGFNYNSGDPKIYTTISELLDLGIEKDKISNHINRSFSIDKIRLNAHLLNNNLTFFPQYRAAIITISMKEKQMFNYQVGDTEGIVNEPLSAKDIDFSIFLHEMSKYTKISLRSKGSFHTNEFAKKFFNGGGHCNASGAEVYDSIGGVYKMVCEALKIMHPTNKDKE